jgi:hypothetical protein
MHALLDAIALTAEQAQREDHDRQDAHRLISQTATEAQSAVDRKKERAEPAPEGLANQRIRSSISAGLRTQTSAARVHRL